LVAFSSPSHLLTHPAFPPPVIKNAPARVRKYLFLPCAFWRVIVRFMSLFLPSVTFSEHPLGGVFFFPLFLFRPKFPFYAIVPSTWFSKLSDEVFGFSCFLFRHQLTLPSAQFFLKRPFTFPLNSLTNSNLFPLRFLFGVGVTLFLCSPAPGVLSPIFQNHACTALGLLGNRTSLRSFSGVVVFFRLHLVNAISFGVSSYI